MNKYENIITGGIKLKGKVILKGNKKKVKTIQNIKSTNEYIKDTNEYIKDTNEYITIPINNNELNLEEQENKLNEQENIEDENKLDIINKRIERVKNDMNLTNSEKTFKIAQIKRTYKRIQESIKESHKEKISKFNTKLSKLSELHYTTFNICIHLIINYVINIFNMSETTFLGTPLSKYDIDNIEINVKNKRGRNYLESKELRYRQNREQIKKNKPKILYTVDTEEGWIPSDFKSSKTNRANYNFQTLSNFTDQDDVKIYLYINYTNIS
ncbi:uncharacterized protein TA18360 [Theileria annulata]|uniref:G patch domain-containing protein n=1 Tax=Theileria annulata TaxID=5874 RepID=Q4UAY4_THEAN|nr:uncharacterized protein TA18360 [Theileria annulata]CAI76017.1 hypothetical protein, conserved [Theileria annulata]|eukprot:XP_955493.1 hypothetical protein, conserved [Theileria annulata]